MSAEAIIFIGVGIYLAIMLVTSILMHRDYAAEALRTPDSLGIGNLTAEQPGSL